MEGEVGGVYTVWPSILIHGLTKFLTDFIGLP